MFGGLLLKPVYIAMIQIVLRGLEWYRRFLFTCHGYPSKGTMPQGFPCNVEDPTIEITHGDVVHPCIRYIEEGFEGHKWWMVYTPYYAENGKLENPRLCYTDVSNGEPPTEWKYYCSIVDMPEIGYNSDPTMLFCNRQLYIYWRENKTPKAKAHGYSRLTVGCRVCKKQITLLSEHQLMETSLFFDKEVCPTFLERNGTFHAYSIHVDWDPKFVFQIPSFLASKLYKYKIIYLIDALGWCDMNKCHGVAIWNSDSLEKTFHYLRTVQFENASKLYQPWHMDIFQSNEQDDDALYAVVQTRQRLARICLAKSVDGETFRFYDKPLMTSKTAEMTGLYKPTALLVGNKFYLFYTVRDNKDCNLHRLFVTSLDWKALLDKMTNTKK